jgi:hypothetical protein
MIGTTAASPHLDDLARLRATPATSWGAIFAGAVVAVSLSVLLMTLGAGLGFASISPWSAHGLSASHFTVASTIWLIITQWLSAATGGYLAGRLRQRWLATHAHEVFFRDTAHGLVTWAVATLVVAAILVSSTSALVAGGARAIGGLAAAGGQGIAAMRPTETPGTGGPQGPGADSSAGYNLDKLFRGNSPGDAPDRSGHGPRGTGARGEVMHIAASSALSGAVSDEDRTYLANLVASETGVSQDEAQKRVDAFLESLKDASAQAKAAADEARKSAATAALYTALTLLIGAFIASVAAAVGGHLRDEHL